MRTLVTTALILLGCLFVIGGAWAETPLQAGAAKGDITPDVAATPIPLGGYAARRAAPAIGVHDPVYARALVLSEGSTKVAIVSVDLCFLPANIRTEVARRVQAALPAGEPLHLFLAATHTHSAPDPLAMHRGNTFVYPGWTRFDGALLDFIAQRIAETILNADKNLRPATVGIATVDASGWNRNRRGGTLTDPAMTLLKVTDSGGKPLAAIVNFASHPTLFSDKMRSISADWPGVMTSTVEQTLGNGAVCLFLNGAEGDASPNRAVGNTEAERVDAYGHAVAALALPKLKEALPAATDPALASWEQPVTLPPRKPNGLFLVAAAGFGATIPQARELVNGLMPETTQLTFVRIGPLLLIGFPCEPTASLGLAAKAAARQRGVTLPAVVALTNDWLGYALTPEEYRLGNYEASMSFYGDQLGPTLETSWKQGLSASPHG